MYINMHWTQILQKGAQIVHNYTQESTDVTSAPPPFICTKASVDCCVNFLYMPFVYIMGGRCKRNIFHFQCAGNVCDMAMKKPFQASVLAIVQQIRLFQIFCTIRISFR